jgi:hypothetical protein
MSTSKTGRRTSKARTARSDLSPTLRTIGLSEARQYLAALDRDWAVVPATGRDSLAATVAEVLVKATEIGITNVDQLIAQQGALLSALTDGANVTQVQKAHVAGPLHTYRNVITAMAATAAAYNHCAPEAVYANAVRLHARTTHTMRPLTDDEIFLLRVHAALAVEKGAASKPASVYAMTDTGLYPSETTKVTLTSFPNPHRPMQISAPGHGKSIGARFLPLDDFGGAILGERTRAACKADLHADTPLTYAPYKNLPGTPQATASAQGVLDRIMSDLGLKHRDVTASSITLWRIHTVYAHEGVAAATQYSGRRTKEQMMSFLFRAQNSPAPAPDHNVRRFNID